LIGGKITTQIGMFFFLATFALITNLFLLTEILKAQLIG
jgi:hypothetical protein